MIISQYYHLLYSFVYIITKINIHVQSTYIIIITPTTTTRHIYAAHFCPLVANKPIQIPANNIHINVKIIIRLLLTSSTRSANISARLSAREET